jgi:hypothetical protein
MLRQLHRKRQRAGRAKEHAAIPAILQLCGAIADHDCFLSLREHNSGTCISQPYINVGTGQHLFLLSRRLEHEDAFEGVAQVGLSVLDQWGRSCRT